VPHAFVTSQTVTPPDALFADLYACWDARLLYLAIHATDFAETQLYQGPVIPEGKRME
jgi:hypothetical protein